MGTETVWLVGMMGAGKSAVGRSLARRRGAEFVDTDQMLEEQAGATVAQIFADRGEAAFRRMEREAIEALVGGRCVVALGGGAIAQPGVAERLRASGCVVYLRARPETLLSRVGAAEERPLLRGLAPAEREARLRALLESRRAAYETARVVVDTDGRSVEEVAEQVDRALEEAG